MNNKHEITLVIDDQKDTGGPGFIICRDSRVAKLVLSLLWGVLDAIWIDFDLGTGSETGAEILKWMFNDLNVRPPKIRIVSHNPVGVVELTAILKDNRYVPAEQNTSDELFDYWLPISGSC